MSLSITGTSYLTTTDDLLGVADEKLVIEGADDARNPQTNAKSFDELEAEGAPITDQVMGVISEVAKKAEGDVEAYARGIYALPLDPLDGSVKSLMQDWFWYHLRKRRSMFRSEEDRILEERNLRARGQQIRNQDIVLTSVLLDQGEGVEEMVYDFGTSDRVAYRDPLPPIDANPFRR